MLAGLVAVAGWMAVTATLAYTMRIGAASRAYALAPWDGRVAATYAWQLAGPKATPANRSKADRLARHALARDATVVSAVTMLGIHSQLQGKTGTARRMFEYAAILSRRDVPTQLWLIEDAVERNDIPSALKHYDISLRTSTASQDVLFPILASAIADETIRVELAETLRSKPRWTFPFVEYAALRGQNPVATAAFFALLMRERMPPPWPVQSALINRLFKTGRWNEAWAHYVAIYPQVDRRYSRDPNFAGDPAAPSVFDWTPMSDSLIQTTMQASEQGGVFDFVVSAGVGGTVLQQSQMLPAGRYVLDGRSTGISQPANSAPYWRLQCEDGRELGRATLTNSAENGGVFRGEYSVPSDCPIQLLSLMVRVSDEPGGIKGQVHRARLRPADTS